MFAVVRLRVLLAFTTKKRGALLLIAGCGKGWRGGCSARCIGGPQRRCSQATGAIVGRAGDRGGGKRHALARGESRAGGELRWCLFVFVLDVRLHVHLSFFSPIYVSPTEQGFNVMLQYQDAVHSTLQDSSALITKADRAFLPPSLDVLHGHGLTQ